jgi:hypothetical protein
LDYKRINQLEISDRRKKKIREDLAYLNTNRLMLLKTGAYTPEKLVAEEANLEVELATFSGVGEVFDVSMQEAVNEAVKFSELLKALIPYYYYSNAEKAEKEDTIRLVFSELTISENTLQYQCKNGFSALASRFIPMHEVITWLSELICSHEDIVQSIQELKTILSATECI